MRLVSKSLNEAIKPALFRVVAPNSDRHLAALADSTIVGYVRVLTIPLFSTDTAEDANRKLQKLLTKLPLLESFRCSCPMLPETINILHRSCPGIKSLFFDFSSMDSGMLGLEIERPSEQLLQAREMYTMPDFAGFGNLQDLALLNLYSNLSAWRDQIVQVLLKSPSLQTLALSLSPDAVSRLSFAWELDQYQGWFGQLCESYGESGGSPLPLRSLRCGTAVFPEDAALLEQLADMKVLEEAHVENTNLWNFKDIIVLYADETDTTDIVFGAFVNAPRMRRFTVGKYAADVHQAFAMMQDPSRARHIALGAASSGIGHEPVALLRADERYLALPVHLRMLEIDLDRGNDDLYIVDDEGEYLEKVDVDTVLESLVEGDEGALEGLVLCLPDAEEEEEEGGLEGHLELLEGALPRLVNLGELYIRGNGYEVESCAAVTTRLASAVPSLRYINVRLGGDDRCYWKISRGEEGVVRLEKLEGRSENEEVELYKFSVYQRSWEVGP